MNGDGGMAARKIAKTYDVVARRQKLGRVAENNLDSEWSDERGIYFFKWKVLNDDAAMSSCASAGSTGTSSVAPPDGPATGVTVRK